MKRTVKFSPEAEKDLASLSGNVNFYGERNLKAIENSIKQIEAGKIVKKTMEELEAMENE